jgi:Chalcone isomerase-like
VTRLASVALCSLALAAPAFSQETVAEPRSGVNFPAKVGDMSLIGTGLRTKTFLKVKVYAIGLYVADGALAGPLHAYKGKTGSPELYRELRGGDFEKQLTMVFTRDLSASQIQGAFRETLEAQDQSKVGLFVGYFTDIKSGQQATLRWAPGGTLEVQVAGLAKPPIADKVFATAVYSIWLGDKPVQDDIKKGLVSRADALIK